jgi:hypothetical protein
MIKTEHAKATKKSIDSDLAMSRQGKRKVFGQRRPLRSRSTSFKSDFSGKENQKNIIV